MILSEDQIEIDFTNALDGFVFDQMEKSRPKYHGIGQMNRVDFVVEMPDFVAYVEIKDPILRPEYPEQRKKFLEEVADGTLGLSFANKLIDSFVYGWAEEKALKPIRYFSLVTLEQPMNVVLNDWIMKKLPPLNIPKKSRWTRPFISAVGVFDIDTWNVAFPEWPARRLPSATGATS